MTPKKPHRDASRTERLETKLRLVPTDNGAWQFRQPACARARQEDLEEVEQMIAAGELEIARDEIRWLLSECHDFPAAHKLLGDLALAEGDFRLARGHYGYAYQLGIQAIDRSGDFAAAGENRQLPYASPANQPFYQAGRGVVQCLLKINRRGLVQDIISRLLTLDPGDPLGIRRLLDQSPQPSKKSRYNKHRRKKRR